MRYAGAAAGDECRGEVAMPESTPPSCPRCGYVQSGEIATWSEKCPLDGVRSECGLEFAWANVLNPRLVLPQWSFEHATNRTLRAWTATVYRATIPWKLWSQLRMEYPINWGRLILLAIFGAPAAHFFVLSLPYILRLSVDAHSTSAPVDRIDCRMGCHRGTV